MSKALIRKTRRFTLSRLEQVRGKLRKKLSDPKDKDDPNWVGHILGRVEVGIAKKEKSVSQRQIEKKPRLRKPRKQT